jgi:hypothetical protein
MVWSVVDKVRFNFDIDERSKARFLWMVQKHCSFMQAQYFGRPIHDKLTHVDVYHESNPSPDLKAYNALGLAYFDGSIAVLYQNYPLHDAMIIGMEHAHNVMLSLLPELQYVDEMNNLVHWGMNYNKMPYIVYRDEWFRRKRDWLLGKPKERVKFGYYSVMHLIRDMQLINNTIKLGTAPVGPHEYWKVSDHKFHQLKDGGIIPGSLETKEAFGHHHH